MVDGVETIVGTVSKAVEVVVGGVTIASTQELVITGGEVVGVNVVDRASPVVVDSVKGLKVVEGSINFVDPAVPVVSGTFETANGTRVETAHAVIDIASGTVVVSGAAVVNGVSVSQVNVVNGVVTSVVLAEDLGIAGLAVGSVLDASSPTMGSA